MEISSHLKGNFLEKAVELIEKAIVKRNPTLKNANVFIERNKINIINGVKHEIDIYVEVDCGNNYKAIFIFECKNWNHKKVGKSPIIEFSEKIKVFNAQTGFFISKGFGKYAIAQSKLDSRVKLLSVKDFLGDNIPSEYPVVNFDGAYSKNSEIILIEKDGIKGKSSALDIENIKSVIGNQEILFNHLIGNIINELIQSAIIEFKTTVEAKGEYPIVAETQFESENFKVNGLHIERIIVKVSFTYIKKTVYPIVFRTLRFQDLRRHTMYTALKVGDRSLMKSNDHQPKKV